MQYGKGGLMPKGVTDGKNKWLIEWFHWEYLLDEIEVENKRKREGRASKDKLVDDWRVAKQTIDGEQVENSLYSARFMYSPSLDKLRQQTESEWYSNGSVSDTFAKGGELNGTIAGDAAKYIAKELSYYVTSIDEQPYNGRTIFYVKDKESVNKTIKALKDLYGIEARVGYIDEINTGYADFSGGKSVEFYNDQIVDTNNKMAKGGTFDSKVNAIAKKLEGKPVPAPYRKEYGTRYDKEDAKEAASRIVGNMRKMYGE
jgi:hypothetical protein